MQLITTANKISQNIERTKPALRMSLLTIESFGWEREEVDFNKGRIGMLSLCLFTILFLSFKKHLSNKRITIYEMN